jgi:hypothetical protein
LRQPSRNALREFSFGMVLSEAHLPNGLCWSDLLLEIQDVPGAASPLIVVDRLADERI